MSCATDITIWSIAYQAVGRTGAVGHRYEPRLPGIPADICIFFDVDPESCHERIENGRVYLEIFERDPEQINAIRERVLQRLNCSKQRHIVVITPHAI